MLRKDEAMKTLKGFDDPQNNLIKQKEDIGDFAQLLKGLTYEEKREVRGIMIGMQITRTSCKPEKAVQ